MPSGVKQCSLGIKTFSFKHIKKIISVLQIFQTHTRARSKKGRSRRFVLPIWSKIFYSELSYIVGKTLRTCAVKAMITTTLYTIIVVGISALNFLFLRSKLLNEQRNEWKTGIIAIRKFWVFLIFIDIVRSWQFRRFTLTWMMYFISNQQRLHPLLLDGMEKTTQVKNCFLTLTNWSGKS